MLTFKTTFAIHQGVAIFMHYEPGRYHIALFRVRCVPCTLAHHCHLLAESVKVTPKKRGVCQKINGLRIAFHAGKTWHKVMSPSEYRWIFCFSQSLAPSPSLSLSFFMYIYHRRTLPPLTFSLLIVHILCWWIRLQAGQGLCCTMT